VDVVMRTPDRVTPAVVVAAVAAVAGSCTLDLSRKVSCQDQRDCIAGYVCSQRTCVAAASLPDAAVAASAQVVRIERATLPLGGDDAAALGLDLDGDPARQVDNGWHRALGFISELGWYSQGGVDDQLDRHELIVLAQLRTLGTTATVSFHTGRRAAVGEDYEAVAPLGELSGTFDGRRLSVGPGRLRVPLALLGGLPSAALVELVGARLEVPDVDRDAGGWSSGRLGGAVTRREIDEHVSSLLAGHVRGLVAIDCPSTTPPCCVDGTEGAHLLGVLDADGDCAVTSDEVHAHASFGSSFALDVDLLDRAAAFAPRSDGVADSLSVGIGVTAVGASTPELSTDGP
jgi:hypothetical protein